MEVTIQWYFLIYLVNISILIFLWYKVIKGKRERRYLYVAFIVAVTVLSIMIKIEPETQQEYVNSQSRAIENAKELPPKVEDKSFKENYNKINRIDTEQFYNVQ